MAKLFEDSFATHQVLQQSCPPLALFLLLVPAVALKVFLRRGLPPRGADEETLSAHSQVDRTANFMQRYDPHATADVISQPFFPLLCLQSLRDILPTWLICVFNRPLNKVLSRGQK